MFSVYKAGLKRFTFQGCGWQAAHILALQGVTRKKVLHFFRKCEVPGCEDGKEDSDLDDDLEFAAVLQAVSTSDCVVVHHVEARKQAT
jgi:hypothetical protein